MVSNCYHRWHDSKLVVCFRSCSSLLLVLLLVNFGSTYGCHPLSRELHICLNVYLERDFHKVQTILEGQHNPGYRTGRILVEGPELDDICGRILELNKCYSHLLKECDTYWQLQRYQSLMKAMSATYAHFCESSTNNLRDVLVNAGCVRNAEVQEFGCHYYGISWSSTWKQIHRLQVSPSDICYSISGYKKCFLKEMTEVFCGKEALQPYVKLIDLWLDNWCGNNDEKYIAMNIDEKNITMNIDEKNIARNIDGKLLLSLVLPFVIYYVLQVYSDI